MLEIAASSAALSGGDEVLLLLLLLEAAAADAAGCGADCGLLGTAAGVGAAGLGFGAGVTVFPVALRSPRTSCRASGRMAGALAVGRTATAPREEAMRSMKGKGLHAGP